MACLTPEGWTIGRYRVSNVDRVLLWSPDGKSRGPYGSVADAITAFNKLRAREGTAPDRNVFFAVAMQLGPHADPPACEPYT